MFFLILRYSTKRKRSSTDNVLINYLRIAGDDDDLSFFFLLSCTISLFRPGVKPDVMLYNALLSVYVQNNHDFNPLEILEKMEKNSIEPNRVSFSVTCYMYINPFSLRVS